MTARSAIATLTLFLAAALSAAALSTAAFGDDAGTVEAEGTGVEESAPTAAVTEVADKRRSERPPNSALSENAPKSVLTISGKPIFVPPNRGTPVARVGGAARAMEKLPGIEALVPLESGLTLEEAPVLYWYLSEATDLPVNFTLIDLDVETPLVDQILEGPFEKGVHRIRIDAYSARLTQGRMYQWFVALVPDPKDRSSDRLAGGGIERVDMKLWLRDRLTEAPAPQVPGILAGAGVWYDALNALSERIDSYPDDPGPREQRSALFEQVGLKAVISN